MIKIKKDRLTQLLECLSGAGALYVPVRRGETVLFERYEKGTQADFDTLLTDVSAKGLFFPQTEDLASFKREGKTLSITAAQAQDEPFVVMGMRACDAQSLAVLDRVFLSDPVDTFYMNRRKNGVVVAMACNQPEETCFCHAFGIDCASPAADVRVRMLEQSLIWEPLTDKGRALTEKISGLADEADQGDLDEDRALAEGAKKAMEQMPLGDLSLEGFGHDDLLEKFRSPKWASLSRACLGCGACTFVCPTCQCYDIRDFDTGNGIQRFRCWDSCMYSDFTMMAHGNPRKTQLERFRQRFMHKLVYFPENNEGMFSCVGCGRCVRKCPSSLNIVKVIKALGGDADVK